MMQERKRLLIRKNDLWNTSATLFSPLVLAVPSS